MASRGDGHEHGLDVGPHGLPAAGVAAAAGRPPAGRRWRWALPLLAFNGLAFAALGVLFNFSMAVGVPGYFSWPEIHALSWPGAVLGVTVLGSYGLALAALLVRFYRASDQVRRQLSWVLLASLIVVVVSALDPILPDSIFSILVIALIPLSITVAVLRYQLLDIRLVLSRSVLYVLLTAAVVGAYLLIVAVLDAVLRTELGLGILRTGHAADCGCLQPGPGLVAAQGRAVDLRCSP